MTTKQKEFLFTLLTVNVPKWQFKHIIINETIDINLKDFDKLSDFHGNLIINLLKENKGINYRFEWDKEYEKKVIEYNKKKEEEHYENTLELVKKWRAKQEAKYGVKSEKQEDKPPLEHI